MAQAQILKRLSRNLFDKKVVEFRAMAKGGNPGGIRDDEDGYKGWEDEDFEALLRFAGQAE